MSDLLGSGVDCCTSYVGLTMQFNWVGLQTKRELYLNLDFFDKRRYDQASSTRLVVARSAEALGEDQISKVVQFLRCGRDLHELLIFVD